MVIKEMGIANPHPGVCNAEIRKGKPLKRLSVNIKFVIATPLVFAARQSTDFL
jgi:hypothetical protein